MARAAYFDCFSGAAGNMLLGALVDAGADLVALREVLGRLPIDGWSLEVEKRGQAVPVGTALAVRVDQGLAQPRRSLTDVESVLARAKLPSAVQDAADAVFRRLAEAEAAVHGVPIEEVHFHEVGAVDAIVDVVGVIAALHGLGVQDAVFASGLPLGTGWVQSAHGPLPVPSPATLHLLQQAGAPTRTPPAAVDGELTTPTGAALLVSLARFEQPAFTRVDAVGYGYGSRILPWPNAVRVWLGETVHDHAVQSDSVVVMETNLDDTTPEHLGFAMERLLEAGALDVSFTPLQMKKNRPGVLLRVLAAPSQGEQLARMILTHTTALGVRWQTMGRYVAARSVAVVSTPWGEVRVKEKRLGATVDYAPEFDDCAALARRANVPLAQVYDAAMVGATRGDSVTLSANPEPE